MSNPVNLEAEGAGLLDVSFVYIPLFHLWLSQAAFQGELGFWQADL